MALFGSKKKTEEQKPVAVKAPARANPAQIGSGHIAHVLKRPRITEKASMHQSIGVYTFDVMQDATKSQIIAEVKSMYKVTPRKVRIVQIPSKQTRSTRTGKRGMRIGGKKAYVYLKSGETITIA
jgi:large subunit ribosomal protein L23